MQATSPPLLPYGCDTIYGWDKQAAASGTDSHDISAKISGGAVLRRPRHRPADLRAARGRGARRLDLARLFQHGQHGIADLQQQWRLDHQPQHDALQQSILWRRIWGLRLLRLWRLPSILERPRRWSVRRLARLDDVPALGCGLWRLRLWRRLGRRIHLDHHLARPDLSWLSPVSRLFPRRMGWRRWLRARTGDGARDGLRGRTMERGRGPAARRGWLCAGTG